MGNVTFAFFDESVSDDLDIASLTAVLVPASKYAHARDRVLRLAASAKPGPPHTISRAIELHGRVMLKDVEGATDDDRLRMFAGIVDIVNSERLYIVSVGYTNWKEARRITPLDDKLHGLNFMNVGFALEPILADGLVVPIVDGLPGGILATDGKNGKRSSVEPGIFRAFIAGIYQSQHIRVGLETLGSTDVMSIKGFGNLVEPTFTDSAMSPLLQLADVVCYLFAIEDTAERVPCQGFKGRLVEIARELDPALVTKWRGTMKNAAAPE